MTVKNRKKNLRPCPKCGTNFDIGRMQCPSCRAWDTPANVMSGTEEDETVLLTDVAKTPIRRISGTGPWDCAFSRDEETGEEGLATVQTVLIAGVPGAGKSTLALQAAGAITQSTKREILYIAAEEAKSQVLDRALRLRVPNPELMRIYPLGATSDIGLIIDRRKPVAVVVDSLPGLVGADLAEAVYCCKVFKERAIIHEIPFLIIDHATKGEEMAGLMALQHEVDTTLMFTTNRKNGVRRLQNHKNRFGALQTLYFEMTARGLIPREEYDDNDDSDDDWESDE